jgi:coenzyme F420-reducing hydrogenase alpha subunit
MAIEGELVVRVTAAGGRVTLAEARAERPRVADRLFAGRLASEAAPLAGTLFAICGRSQAVAAAAAVDAAKREAPGDGLRRARAARIAGETIHEHAWRFLVDWPALAGRAPAVGTLATARRALAPILAAEEGADLRAAVHELVAWAAGAVFGRPPAGFLTLDSIAALRAWAGEGGTPVASLAAAMLDDRPSLGASDVDLLPPGRDDWIARELAPALDRDARFEARPHLGGEPRETGALARTQAHPLVADAIASWGRGVGARVAARLVDMAVQLEALAADDCDNHGATPIDGAGGLAWVETARGLLVHRVSLHGERVGGYRIVAPTEWNFHPDGAFTRGALGMAAAADAPLERDVRRLVASLDPCVGVRCEVGHA